MKPLDALLELLAHLEDSDNATALVSEGDLSRWPAEAVRELKSQKLLVRASPAASVVCSGCEQECVMQVYTLPAANGAADSFVVCDKRDDINRVAVPAERLKQWRCGAETIGAFVAKSLGLQPGSQRKADAERWDLGLVTGKRRSQMVCLRTSGALELVAGENAIPLSELVRFGVDGYSVDSELIQHLVDAATTGDPRYTPSVARREARRLKTVARHKSWQKEYRALKRLKPGKTDLWYSEQIAKSDFGGGCSSETIRKLMKR